MKNEMAKAQTLFERESMSRSGVRMYVCVFVCWFCFFFNFAHAYTYKHMSTNTHKVVSPDMPEAMFW